MNQLIRVPAGLCTVIERLDRAGAKAAQGKKVV